MESMVTELSQGFGQLKTDVKDIKTFLLGNEFTGDKGASHTITDHEKRLLEIENWKRTELQQEKDKATKANFWIKVAMMFFAFLQLVQAFVLAIVMNGRH